MKFSFYISLPQRGQDAASKTAAVINTGRCAQFSFSDKTDINMGFASYLEDIISKVSIIEEIVEEQRRPTDKSVVGKHVGLRKKEERLEDVTNRLRKEIADLQTIIQKLKKESAEKGFLLRKEQGKAHSLTKQIDHESGLRKVQERTVRDSSDLVIDLQRLFQAMHEIAKSNAWYKDRSKIKQLESLIESGLRRN